MTRQAMRRRFLRAQGLEDAEVVALDPDASARRYFRLPGHGLLLMDAPPPGERPAAFIAVTGFLARLGARVPRIHAADARQGFVLLEDLGDGTFTRLLAGGAPEEELYGLAMDELIRLQTRCGADMAGIDLPPYDESAALKEAALFTEWYLPARLGHALKDTEHGEYLDVWSGLFHALPPLEPVLVHRDFHVDNLLLVGQRCAMIDYQDALLGSPVYDVVSLVEDARRDVDPAMRARLVERWRDCLDIPAEPYGRHAAFWAAQRHCKVAGIFVRLWLRDGKGIYLQHLDRVVALLGDLLAAEESLAPLRDWIAPRMTPVVHRDFTESAEALRRRCGVHAAR